jgi:hypothetical protein
MSLPVLTQDLGDDRTYTLPLKTPEGVAYSAAGKVLIFTAKFSKNDLDSAAAFQKAIGAGLTASGTNVILDVLRADTINLTERSLYCDVQAQDEGTQKVITVWKGVLKLTRDVTRLTSTSVDVKTTSDPLPIIFLPGWPLLRGAVTEAGRFEFDEATAAAVTTITIRPTLESMGSWLDALVAGDNLLVSGTITHAAFEIVSVSSETVDDVTTWEITVTSGTGTLPADGANGGIYSAAKGNQGATHDPATVSGNGITIIGQQISLSIGTGSTQVAAGNHLHTGVYAPVSHTHVSAGITDASTGGNGAEDGGKVLKFRSDGSIFATGNADAAIIAEGSDGVPGVAAASDTGAGITSSTNTGDYHSRFGNSGNDRSFVARELGAFGWWRGEYTLKVSAVDALTENRVQRFQDKDGTIALTSDIPDGSAYATAAQGAKADSAIQNGYVSWVIPAAGAAENLAKWSVSDAPGDSLNISNGTSTAAAFGPVIYGETTSSSSRVALLLSGRTSAANDTGTVPLVLFDSRRNTPAAITTRPCFEFKNFTTSLLILDASGNATLTGELTAAGINFSQAGAVVYDATTAASAATLDLSIVGADQNIVQITGTTAITNMTNIPVGKVLRLWSADGTGVVITHGNNIYCKANANITLAGDEFVTLVCVSASKVLVQ